MYPWPDPTDAYRFTNIRADCERVVFEEARASACKGIIAGTLEVSSLDAWPSSGSSWTLSRTRRWLVRSWTRRSKIKLRFWETVFTEIGDILDVIYDADDYGSPTALLIAPDPLAKDDQAAYLQLDAFVHSHSRAKVFLHSDGAIRSLILGPHRGRRRRAQSRAVHRGRG